MPNSAFDLVVVGGGPAGYVSAIKAAQLGLKVACVEGRGSLGGTCLNVGCIPSKVLLHGSHCFHESRGKFARLGLSAVKPSYDWKAMQAFKAKTVSQLTKGIEHLFRKNGVHYVSDWGLLTKNQTVQCQQGGELSAKHIILATGSVPAPLPGVNLTVDETRVLTSTGALQLEAVPSDLLIIGAGAIGLEFASIYSRLGSKVEVVEFMPQVAVGFDRDAADGLKKCLEKEGVKFHLNYRVQGVSDDGDRLSVTALDQSGQSKVFGGERLLICVGRRANVPKTAGVDLELDKAGRIVVDDYFRTSIPSVYAVGDTIKGPMLAHKAEEDGIACVKGIVEGGKPHVDYNCVPAVIYTHPELAMVGETEASLTSKSIPYKKGVFPLAANARARCMGESDGFVKVLVDSSGKVVGGCILGPGAGEQIQVMVMAVRFGMKAEALGDLVHPHPCLIEAFKEANLAAVGHPIHM